MLSSLLNNHFQYYFNDHHNHNHHHHHHHRNHHYHDLDQNSDYFQAQQEQEWSKYFNINVHQNDISLSSKINNLYMKLQNDQLNFDVNQQHQQYYEQYQPKIMPKPLESIESLLTSTIMPNFNDIIYNNTINESLSSSNILSSETITSTKSLNNDNVDLNVDSLSLNILTLDTILTLILPYSIIFILSIVGNLLVIITLTMDRSMRSVTNIFLLHLAISDLLLGVFCMPFTLVGVLLRRFIFGAFVCHMISYFQAVSVAVSVWTLVSMSIERYYAICHPFRSRESRQTRKHAYRILAMVWTLAFITMSPTAIVSELQQTNQTGHYKCREAWPSFLHKQVFTLFLDVILLILPLIIMILTYSSIALTLRHSVAGKKQKHHHNDYSDNGNSNNNIIYKNFHHHHHQQSVAHQKHHMSPSMATIKNNKNTIYSFKTNSINKQQRQFENYSITDSSDINNNDNNNNININRCQKFRFQKHNSDHNLSNNNNISYNDNNCSDNSINKENCRQTSKLSTKFLMKNRSINNLYRIQSPILNNNHNNNIINNNSNSSSQSLNESSGFNIITNTNNKNANVNTNNNANNQKTSTALSTTTTTILRVGNKNYHSYNNNNYYGKHYHHASRQRHIITMLFVVVIEFFICWTPIFLLDTMALYRPALVYGTSQKVSKWIGIDIISVCHLLCFCSTCNNPITYCFMSKRFRSHFFSLFRCRTVTNVNNINNPSSIQHIPNNNDNNNNNKS